MVALTALNLAGTLQSKLLQKVCATALLIAGLLAIALAGLLAGGGARRRRRGRRRRSFGLAMIFVLLTYGGWNEAAYLAGEVRDARRNMLSILVGGIVAVTALYLLVNLGYLAALGLGGMRASKAVGADADARGRRATRARSLLALIVCVSALTTINAAIFTGARTYYALGRDYPIFRKLGAWREAGSTPANALLAAGRDRARAGRRRGVHARRLQRDGGLHGAGVLDVLPADRASRCSFFEGKNRQKHRNQGAASIPSSR